VVLIRNLNKDAPITLSFFDHGRGGVQIHWLNEKLLYGSVWWGRVLSTDFIFDVEQRVFLYKEMANYDCFITQGGGLAHVFPVFDNVGGGPHPRTNQPPQRSASLPEPKISGAKDGILYCGGQKQVGDFLRTK